MLRVEIYHNGRILDIKAEEIIHGKSTMYFLNKDVVDFIKDLEKEKLSKVKVDGSNIVFHVNGDEVIIKNYNTLKNYPIFEKLRVILNREYRKEKLRKSKLNRLKLVTTAILLSAGISASFLLKENANVMAFPMIDKTSDLVIEEIEEEKPEIIINNEEFVFEEEVNEITNTNETTNVKTYNYDIDIPFNDRTDSPKYINCKEQYGELITKYANMYGLDPNLMIAVATQESGVHNPYDETTGAIGLMQIEKSVWNNKSITVYNYETKEDETLNINLDTMINLETNIKLGCMIMRQQMDYMRNNPVAALWSYNYGYGNMNVVLNAYAKEKGVSINSVLDNYYDFSYITNKYYANLVSYGDSYYVEHVLSYMGDNPTLVMNIRDDAVIEMNINNAKSSVRS